MCNELQIICVGNELLIGKTLNTNAHWLAKRVTNLGFKVDRITSIRDNIDDISSAVKESLRKKPKFIIITGGLGPTFDDMTLVGVAKGLKRSIEENQEALDMIKKKYELLFAKGQMNNCEMTPHRRKMASLPEGGKPLPNPLGTAPGVLVEDGLTNLIMLPGVPREMMAIFDDSITHLLKKQSVGSIFFEASLKLSSLPESELAPIIDRVMNEIPHVYIKSHPQGSEGNPLLEIHISTTSEDSELARKRINQVIILISSIIQDKGGKIIPIKKSF